MRKLSIDSLHHTHAMVVGCGALGNEVLKNLVLMGIGRITIVDFDVVEVGNLTRSVLYRRSDVGLRKVDVARRALLDINPELEVHAIHGDVAYDVGLGVFAGVDMVFGCVDSRWARYCIQRACLRVGKTWINGGILGLEGTVQVFRPGCSCYACSLGPEGLRNLRQRMPCSGIIRRQEMAGHAPTTPIAASVAGAVMVQEGIRLVGVSDEMAESNRMFYYDGESMSVHTPVSEAWDDDCELHGEWRLENVLHVALDDRVGELPGVLILNNPFVDFIVDRRGDERVAVMLPADRVAAWFEGNPDLSGRLMSEFYQNEWREIDGSFPYGDMTLRELGVPPNDILRVRRDNDMGYLIADAS